MAEANEKTMEENTVWYRLYPLIKPGRSSKEYLSQYITEVLSRLAKHLTGYIWQKEPFILRVVEDALHQGPHIEGFTCFGDYVEDEWFIVYLLLELTKHDPELVVKIEDSDGEFLLIEAADCLPRWANPDTCENRVYLFQSEVHLLPLKKGPIPSDTPLIPEATKAIRSYRNETRCSESIQSTIQKRIKDYPSRIKEFQHKAKCYVPAAVATLLDQDPSLISAAVGAFYYRDPVDMKACKVMKYFPPENRVMKTVTMTRCMYGQLMGQKYNPDRKIGWEMPPANASSFKSYDLGMKVACGFEILVAAAKSKPKSDFDFETEAEELEQDHRWQRFAKNLENNGYFQSLIKGSAGHSKLLKDAQSFYLRSLNDNIHKNSSRNDVSQRVLHMLETIEIDFEKLKRESRIAVDDDDKWLHVSPDDFEQMLNQRFTANNGKSQQSKKLPQTLNNFLNTESGIEGAEVPRKPPRRKKATLDKPSPTSEAEDNSKLSFEPESFSDALRSILTMHVPHTDSDASSSSGMSDYSDESDTHSISEEEQEELNITKIKSSKSKKRGHTKPKCADTLVDEMKTYMDQMDRELEKTNIGQSFERKGPPLATYDEDDEEDEYKPVDVDMTALKNIIESFNSQQGLPGPSTTILQSMGMHLNDKEDNSS